MLPTFSEKMIDTEAGEMTVADKEITGYCPCRRLLSQRNVVEDSHNVARSRAGINRRQLLKTYQRPVTTAREQSGASPVLVLSCSDV